MEKIELEIGKSYKCRLLYDLDEGHKKGSEFWMVYGKMLYTYGLIPQKVFICYNWCCLTINVEVLETGDEAIEKSLFYEKNN
jgi:hypothetical protein